MHTGTAAHHDVCRVYGPRWGHSPETRAKEAREGWLAWELETLHNKPPGTGMRPHELQLAAYLLMKAATGSQVEGVMLSKLRLANDTVEEARTALWQGRGNVVDDIEKSNSHSTHLTKAGRQVVDAWKAHVRRLGSYPSLKDYWQMSTAMAHFTAAGFCREHAGVTAHLHASKLTVSETVHIVASTSTDHCWAEWRIPDSRWVRMEGENGVDADGSLTYRLNVDSWADGPACFAEDSSFGRFPEYVCEVLGYAAVEGQEAAWNVQQLIQKAGASLTLQETIRSSIQHSRDTGYQISKRYAPTAVLASDFVRNAVARLAPHLSTEVRAVGVLRALGEPVRRAVAMADAVADTARNHSHVRPS